MNIGRQFPYREFSSFLSTVSQNDDNFVEAISEDEICHAFLVTILILILLFALSLVEYCVLEPIFSNWVLRKNTEDIPSFFAYKIDLNFVGIRLTLAETRMVEYDAIRYGV